MSPVAFVIRASVVLLFWGGFNSTAAEPQVLITAHFKERTKAGENVLSAPRVVTLSGRQAVISVLNQMELAGLLKSGSTNPPPAAAGSVVPKNDKVATRKFETGTTLDITPFVKAGRIEYHGTATVKTFLGYSGDKENISATFAVREIHFSGVANDHEKKSLELNGGGMAKDMELWLTFSLVDSEGNSAARKTGQLRR